MCLQFIISWIVVDSLRVSHSYLVSFKNAIQVDVKITVLVVDDDDDALGMMV